MDRPPHSNLPESNSRDPTPGKSQPSESEQETILSDGAPNISTLPTLPAPMTSADNPKLSSASLAVLGRRYDILSEAGHGSFGNVYKARDRETNETVALKVLKPEIASDQAMVERFKNELLFARKITHKNVCRVYEFNRVGAIAYTSMEFVEGESLRSVLNRFGGLPLRKAVELALQMCSGLQEAHAQGIVHRDLKPENVMIDEQGNLKIMDFGIARSMGTTTQLTGAMIGTPAYMAPEQVSGNAVDYRTDIYAFGLMLYEVFTGKQPFHADNAIAIALKQMNESPAPPHEIEPSIPPVIEDAIMKCLEKEPASRFQSISELDAVLRSQAVAPAQVSSANPSNRSSNDATMRVRVAATAPIYSSPVRQKSKYTFAIVALALLGAFAAVGAVVAWRETAVRNAAEKAPPPASVSSSVPVPPSPAPDNAAARQAEATTPAANSTPPKQQKTEVPSKVPSEIPSEVSRSAEPTPAPAAVPTLPVAAPVQTSADQFSAAAAPVQPSASRGARAGGRAGSQNNQFYIWVGRFARDVGAQNASKKIEDMGLPVTVVPRHDNNTKSEFFVVMSGPFAPKEIEGNMEKLKAKGFANVRQVKGLGAAPIPGTSPTPPASR